MNSFCFSNRHKNKLILIIVILLLSLISMYMPHGLVETYEHHDYDISFKHIINNNKPARNLKKLLKKVKSFILKIFRLPQILLNKVALANIHLVLLNMCFKRFSKVSILQLFSLLCFYFHGSKYKHSMNHSELLSSMAT